MTTPTYHVVAWWDPEAEVYVATHENVPGLATEAPGIESLRNKLEVLIPELLETNGVLSEQDEVLKQAGLPKAF